MNFKTWQVLVLSLVPLALVFAGVIAGSFHGTDSGKEALPTAAPRSSTSGTAPATSGSPAAGGGTVLQLTAQNIAFNPRSLTAPANTQVTVRLNNQDSGVPHNFALYRDNRYSQKIFAGDLDTGPAVKDYAFTTPGPGTYFFRCDVHPDQMTGSFVVR